jgi:hypothetical protein
MGCMAARASLALTCGSCMLVVTAVRITPAGGQHGPFGRPPRAVLVLTLRLPEGRSSSLHPSKLLLKRRLWRDQDRKPY